MMQDQNYQKNSEINIPLCTKCLYCILKDGKKTQKVYCKKEYFRLVELNRASTFIPFDWDCFEYNEV